MIDKQPMHAHTIVVKYLLILYNIYEINVVNIVPTRK